MVWIEGIEGIEGWWNGIGERMSKVVFFKAEISLDGFLGFGGLGNLSRVCGVLRWSVLWCPRHSVRAPGHVISRRSKMKVLLKLIF